ncbi:MAG TPA: Uma2 family endonuclease, partial [Archangium sp.]
MGRGKKPATYADIEALPDGWVGELLEDELLASPRPAVGHAHCASVLGVALGGPFFLGSGGPGGWWFLDEPELH